MNKLGPADMACLDFPKAFDIVPHQWLLMQLSSCGIKGKVVSLTKNRLKDRKQTVISHNGGKYLCTAWNRVLHEVWMHIYLNVGW